MKFLEPKKEYIHSWYLFIMTFLGLIFLLASSMIPLNVVLSTFLIFLYLKNGMRFSTIIKLTAFAFSFSFLFFLLNLLYSSEKFKVGEQLLIFNMPVYKAVFYNGLRTFAKLFLLSLVSMSSTFGITYTKVILHLIIHKGLKVLMGYPLLIALNSILLFKEEFERIRLAGKFRGLGWKDRLFMLFPLLVFAIRHSQRGSLSLVTRGLNPNKSFYFGYELNPSDKKWLKLYLLGLIIMVAIAIYFR